MGAIWSPAASVGVATFTADFTSTADALEKDAATWLKWASAMAVFTVIVALLFPFIFRTEGATFTLHAAQLVTSKPVTLGALFTATVWCGRMYKATKHQAAINRHRAYALKTFQAFIKASSDDATREDALLETTRSIFALANPGYLDGGDQGADGALKILEVVKTATSAGK